MKGPFYLRHNLQVAHASSRVKLIRGQDGKGKKLRSFYRLCFTTHWLRASSGSFVIEVLRLILLLLQRSEGQKNSSSVLFPIRRWMSDPSAYPKTKKPK